MLFTANTLLHWYNSYCLEVEEGVDRHQLFADLQGISRQEAKCLCYSIGCSMSMSDIIKSFK